MTISLITDELVNHFYGVTQLSSGPPVYIYYHRIKKEFDVCLGNSVLLEPNDKQIVFKYEVSLSLVSSKNLKCVIRESMIDFIKKHRDEKIDSIIGKNNG